MMDIEKRSEVNIPLYEKVVQLKQYSKFIVENAYYDEIVSFFNAISNNMEPIYDFKKDKIILDLIDRIEV